MLAERDNSARCHYGPTHVRFVLDCHSQNLSHNRCGKIAPKYHTPRFTLVPQLHAELEVRTVHEMKRLARAAAELLTIAEQLRHHDIELEVLTGLLQGVYDPSGHSTALFAFFAGTAESERAYIREKPLEGQAPAREHRRHGGRPRVFDDDMTAYARTLREGWHQPERRAYNKRLRNAAGLMRSVNRILATTSSVWSDDVWVVDSTPVE